MNNFATIQLAERLHKVSYYTLTLNNDKKSLFSQFIDKHTVCHKDKLNHIMDWLKVIGSKIGAKDSYFRHESHGSEARALPPKGINKEPVYIEYNPDTKMEEPKANSLRLYCFRANGHVVFLFNGDVKTTDKAQDCDQVRPHFRMANILSKVIDKAFIDGDIRWNPDQTDIVIDNDYELNW